MKIEQAQKYLQERLLDGWLLYDFHGNNPLARQFLLIDENTMTTRRFFYWIPRTGTPVKLVHAIEEKTLDGAPGEKRCYSSWQSLEKELKTLLKGSSKVAMEYSPQIPYVSLVDGGTIDRIRSFGVEVVSSADFLPHFTAVLTQAQLESQRRAAKALDAIIADAWHSIRESMTEYQLQQKIVADFKKKGLVADHFPIVAVNAHSADPHYEPQREGSSSIRKGDLILIDLWAKENKPHSVYGDITRVAVFGEPTAKQNEVFSIVRSAQQAAIQLVKSRFYEKKRMEGWEVDEAARAVIRAAGYEKNFIHRTGHNIGVDLHGSGAHMDNLEMHDVRPILAGTCFSIEPGIYLPGQFGVRLELDLLIDHQGQVEITGGEQESIVILS